MRVGWQVQYTLAACRDLRVGCSGQAQQFVLLDSRFSWQAQSFSHMEKMFFVESQWQDCANMAQCQKVDAGTAFCESIEKWRKLRETAGSLTRTAVLGASNSQPGESLLRFAGRGNTPEACE